MTPHVPQPPEVPHDPARDEMGWFRRRVRVLYRHYFFRDRRRERFFLASLGFFVCFGITRWLTHSMRHLGDGGLAVWWGDTHVHHLVWGILLLLGVGYLWLHEAGTGSRGLPLRTERLLAIAYGVGAALTLDEFALWLNLEDVYWQEEGRASIDAVTLFGGLVSAGLWGGPFLRAVARLIARVIRRRSHEVVAAVTPPAPAAAELAPVTVAAVDYSPLRTAAVPAAPAGAAEPGGESA